MLIHKKSTFETTAYLCIVKKITYNTISELIMPLGTVPVLVCGKVDTEEDKIII